MQASRTHVLCNQSVHCPSQKEKGGRRGNICFIIVFNVQPQGLDQSLVHGGHATNLCQIIELVNN